MTNKMETEEESLFRSYPYAVYFVQSPSTTVSHSNTATAETPNRGSSSQDAARFAVLSRYPSSRGSNHSSFLQEKKIAYDVGDGTESGENRLISVVKIDGGDDFDYYEDEEDYFGRSSSSWWRYFSFRTSSSFVWICLQIVWRFLVSLGIALLVFYIATKPPSPKISLKVTGIRQFGLAEGVDMSGVTTKILNCNCSMNLLIENKSKLFGLHVHPPIIGLSFEKLPLASSYGSRLYVWRDSLTVFPLNVATANKPVYGAGRAMQDMLDMKKGLPLIVHVRLRSSFRVIPRLIKPKFHHKAECLLFLEDGYDKKHQTQTYNSTCIVTSY